LKLGRERGISTVAVVIIVIVIVVGAVVLVAYTESLPKVTLIVYSADAYVAEANSLESGFTGATGIHMAPPKGAGSTDLAQQIASGDPDDVFISVSKSAAGPEVLKNQSEGWAVAFAADQMVIAYTNGSASTAGGSQVVSDFRATSQGTNQSWAKFFSDLTSGGVKVGISDPNSDPAGFRGWIVLEAAGYTYDSGNQTAYSSSLLAHGANSTAASAADLVAPLQAGNIQFLFIYKSAAISDNLTYFALPSLINLGSSSNGAYYSKFTYTTSTGVEKGGPILLLVTVPVESKNQLDSIEFVTYVVKNDASLSSFGLTILSPAKVFNDSAVPSQISQLVSGGYAVYGGSL